MKEESYVNFIVGMMYGCSNVNAFIYVLEAIGLFTKDHGQVLLSDVQVL